MQDEDYILTIAIMTVLYEYRDRIYTDYINTDLTEEIASKIVDISMKFTQITELITSSCTSVLQEEVSNERAH
ncbi:MAG: hypothetical protein WD424_05915 [Paenibacillaceae bacterium]